MKLWLLRVLFCSAYAAVPEKTLNNLVRVYALVGTNLSLDSMKTPQIDELTSLSWIKQEDNPNKNLQSFFFIGQLHREVTKDKITVFDYYPLEFSCANVTLYLYSLKTDDSGLYNGKAHTKELEHNTYVRLYVIDIPPPKCDITSRYLGIQATGEDYCLIEINCTNSKYPAVVKFNGRQSNFYHYVSENGNKELPNFYETHITINGKLLSFHFNYPFNDLCQTTSALQYNDNGRVVLILKRVIKVISFLGTLTVHHCHRQTIKAEVQHQPVHICLEK
ncbi:E3 31.6 kd protein [Human adenovirus 41]|uniref:E3 31.6 kd protein n=1 Tax=Human adenovirus F serotype 41 TaxID=10524 RepID=A0A7U3NJI5_ADE41|nr:E3 31.6 kd protein [Human adenovirus 41]